MICHFCNSMLRNTAPADDLKETFLFYVCNGCQPREVIYRELYDNDTKDLLADAIRIDEYYIIRNHHSNETFFDKNHITFFKMKGIWKIPSTDIDTVKQKLQIYSIFS